MAKITRQVFKLFGKDGATSNFGKFGSKAAASPVTTKDISTIQSLAAWLEGWQDATVLDSEGFKAPLLEDRNSLDYVFAYQIAYQLQEGIAEWQTDAVYYIGSIVKKSGTFELYGSKINDNTGNSLPSQVDDSNWRYLGNIGQLLSAINKNWIDNGSCRDGSGGTYTLVKDAYDFACRNLYGMATGTTVDAGTLQQITNANIGLTGYASKFAGVTITGTGVIYKRYRIQSKDAVNFKNKKASFQCLVYHDVGSSINYTVYIRKADAQDDFSSVTDISNSGLISVDDTTSTSLKYESISMGDCSNGIEIEIKVDCGAITTKNFEFTEFQFELGDNSTLFERKLYKEEKSYTESFVNFTISGAAATILSSKNVSSVTYVSAGRYKINWQKPYKDNKYCANVSGTRFGDNAAYFRLDTVSGGTPIYPGYVQVASITEDGTAYIEASQMCVRAIGVLA